jgi:hypothetical protein
MEEEYGSLLENMTCIFNDIPDFMMNYVFGFYLTLPYVTYVEVFIMNM